MVTILDDGIEKDHPDLISNYVSQKYKNGAKSDQHRNWKSEGQITVLTYGVIFSIPLQDAEASYDVNDGDTDPQPRYTQRNENR